VSEQRVLVSVRAEGDGAALVLEFDPPLTGPMVFTEVLREPLPLTECPVAD
jgi:hypothetical protein